MNSQLTLNLGVRWEYQQLPQPTETETKGVKFTGNPAYPATVTFHQDKNNFGPRVGFTLRHQRLAHHRRARRLGSLLRSFKQQRDLYRADEQRRDVCQLQLHADVCRRAAVSERVHVAAVNRCRSRNPVSFPHARTPRDQHGRIDRRSGSRPGYHGLRVVSLQPRQALTDLRGHESESRELDRWSWSWMARAAEHSRSSGVHGPTRTSITRIEVADIVDSTYNALVLQANKRFSKGLVVQRQLHAVEGGRHRTELDDLHLELRDDGRPVQQRRGERTGILRSPSSGVASVHYAPDFLWGFQIGGTGTFESGLPLNPTITINSGALNGTGALSTQSVNGSGASNRAPFDTRNGFRQTARKTIDMRVSKRFRLGGTRQIEALWEAFNIFNTINYTGLRDNQIPRRQLDLRRDNEQGGCELDVEYRVRRTQRPRATRCSDRVTCRLA